MGAPDFESRRLERLQESDPFGEPIEFTLYGRAWRCVMLLPMEAMQPVAEAVDTDAPTLLAALHGMIHESVIDKAQWVECLLAEPLDPDTVAEVANWLADIYGWRWKLHLDRLAEAQEQAEREAAEPAPAVPDPGLAAKFSEARADTLETPLEAAHRRRVYKMAQIMQSGGDVAVPTDVEGYEAWEEARQVVAAGAVGAYADG